MADSRIQDLPAIDSIETGDLFPVARESDAYNARKVTAGQMTDFIEGVAQPFLDGAQTAAGEAEQSAIEAAGSAEAAAQSAQASAEYSGKPPIIKNGTWWTWNADLQDYVDTGEPARGEIQYATFEIDVDTGILVMTFPDEYSGPTFQIVDGRLEVVVGG